MKVENKERLSNTERKFYGSRTETSLQGPRRDCRLRSIKHSQIIKFSENCEFCKQALWAGLPIFVYILVERYLCKFFFLIFYK